MAVCLAAKWLPGISYNAAITFAKKNGQDDKTVLSIFVAYGYTNMIDEFLGKWYIFVV